MIKLIFMFFTIASFHFFGSTKSSNPPEVGRRVYVLKESGEIKIYRDSQYNYNEGHLYFRDPKFDKHHFEELLAAEKKALLERSKLKDKRSFIDLGEIFIRGRAAKPRVQFDKKPIPLPTRFDALPQASPIDELPINLDW